MTSSWAPRSRAGVDHGKEGIVGPHDDRLHVLARLLRAIDDGRHQVAGVFVEFRAAAGDVAALGHLGRHHGHVGRSGSVSARVFSSMKRLFVERIATSLR